MKKKIAILGSTGSIGKSLIDIIKKDKKNFEITLLSANKNCQSATMFVSSEGLIKINFKIDSFTATYFLVAKSTND